MVRTLVLLVLCASTAAADGVYVTESVGGTAAEGASDGVRVRLSAGMRRGSWAIEGWLAGDLATHGGDPAPPVACRSTTGCSTPPAIENTDGMLSVGVDAKYIKPLSRHFEVYLRGGLGRVIADSGYEGNGVGIGAGVQLKGRVRALGLLFWPMFFVPWGPKVTAALFVDNGVTFYRLNGDAQLSHLSLGWAVGTDF